MTIDDAIKDFKSTQVDPLSSRCNAVFNIVRKIIDEWQWYQSQDLIPRDDAIVSFDKDGFMLYDGTSWVETDNVTKSLMAIPKAEPPKE